MTFKRIITELLRLHDQQQPLNLTAVKRRRPDLVAAVYDLQPFVGWRGAVLAAGLRYEDLDVELLEFLRCAICGKEVKNLSNHALLGHGCAWAEYLEVDPSAAAIAEQTLAKTCFREFTPVPHWEPVWSAEYALDRLRTCLRSCGLW